MLSEMVRRYIEKTEQVLQFIVQSGNLNPEKTGEVLDHAQRYLEDAKYYMRQKRFETALASVAYSEGLLDALRLLHLVDFEWPSKRR